MTAVVLQRLSRRYRETTVVDSLDLDISDKEFVVVLGPSGCGKTTTLNMIAGTDAPTSGHILFDGRPIEHIPPEKRNVAMVFQSIALYPHKTVYENIAFPLRMAKVTRKEIEERVRAAAKLLHIGELLNRSPHELSGGERQRVALGRAVVRETFKISRVGTIAGCDVTQGTIERSARVRVIREGVVIYPPPDRTAGLESLKHFKEDRREIREGFECGLKIAGYDDVKVGDVIEAYRVEQVQRTL